MGSGISTCLFEHALPIERRLPRSEWAAAIARVPDEHRAEVAEYLRGRWACQVAWERARVAPAAESRDTPRRRKPRA